MAIKVLAFNGSARKDGNTATLLKKVIKHCKDAGAETELIHLIDKNIKPCMSCLAEEKCGFPCKIKDDMEGIFKEIEKADCLLFGSPTYWYSMSGLMKNFIDRLTAGDLVEPAKLEGKIVGFVATALLDGSEQVIMQMTAPISSMGGIIVPYSDVFSNDNKVWRSDMGVNPEKRLARNLIRLAEITKKEQGKWFFRGKD